MDRRRPVSALVGVVLLSACTSGEGVDQRSPIEQTKTVAHAGWFESACSLPIEQLRRIRRGYVPRRSPDVTVVPREPNFFGSFSNTTHSGPWDYLQSVPLVFYGPGFIKEQGRIDLDREVTVADLAPTIAELVDAPFPSNRSGRPITEALVPPDQRPGAPALVLTVVWDGGGTNVLQQWPRAWPFLRSLMRKGTSVDATVGSSPSVTPAIHTTIGSGAFPRQHGIVSIEMRDGAKLVKSFGESTPNYLEVPSLADIYDLSTGNRAMIGMFAEKNWMLGMVGHGAHLPGGDKDIAVMMAESGSRLHSNETWYSLPAYVNDVPGFEDLLRQVDIEDGEADGLWLDRDTLTDLAETPKSPAWVLHQTKIVKEVLAREDFGADEVGDLFFVNYKQIDHWGHLFNMLGPEVQGTIRYTDAALKDLVRFMNRRIGRNRWVVAVTADHGQTPLSDGTRAWPIDMRYLQRSMAKHFSVSAAKLFQGERPNGFWLHGKTMKRAGLTTEDVARFLFGYRLRDNIAGKARVPAMYTDRRKSRLFAAAFPSNELDRIWRCARSRS